MGEAKRRQPDREIRVLEAVERNRLKDQARKRISEEKRRAEYKLKTEKRCLILDDDTLDDATKSKLIKALDKSNEVGSLLATMAAGILLTNNPAMDAYKDIYSKC